MGAYRSPEEGNRRREERSHGRGLEELFSGRQGDLDVDGEGKADSANRVRETNREGETKGDDEPHEEGAGEQREMPARVDDDDPAQGGVAAEPSTAEAEGKGGTRDLLRDREKGDGGGRGSGACSPDPRQQRDKGHPRLPHEDGRHGSGYRSPGRQQLQEERRRGGYRSPELWRHQDSGRGEVCTHQIRGGITTGEAGGSCALQVLVTLVMRDVEATTARLICNGIMERGGEARRARPTGTGNMKKAGEADTARSFGNREGMRGAAEGITHLIGTGSMTEDVLVREDGINATAERKAAG
ncbi:unnamed protein product [Closterium sp. NIES-64]|nr:unnamed protein product [Closterium sp. NIES-64]